MKDYRKFLDGSKADTKRFTVAPDYRLPLHHPKNNAGTTSAISTATQEIIAKEIAKHLDEALRGVERILFNHGMRLDTKARGEMSEMQTDIKTLLQTLVRRWKL